MDSLLASYASSDDDEQEQKPQPPPLPPQDTNSSRPSSSSIFSSLPPPKSSSTLSLFNSLPPPKSTLPQTLITPQSSKPINRRPQEDDDDDDDDDDMEVAFGSREESSTATNFSSSGKPSSLFSSLPEPKISSAFSSSLPPPKTGKSDSPTVTNLAGPSISSSLPPPKAHQSDSKAPPNLPSSSDRKTKKVVQFRPPINAAFMKSRDDDDEDEDEKEEKRRKKSKEFAQTATVKSFLSSIPAPRNSVGLGALSSSGSGRRAAIEADVPASNHNEIGTQNEVKEARVDVKESRYNETGIVNEVNEISVNSNSGNYEGQWPEGSYSAYNEDAAGSSEYTVGASGTDPSYGASTNEYDNYNYGNYTDYGQYDSNSVDGMAVTSAADMSGMGGSAAAPDMFGMGRSAKFPGRRGRTDIPLDIIEVKQDELIKDRPREDQVKMTGIAFGPAYQAPASTKGKPTKLHKRKHQIGSLYFDMRQKEMELAERRSKGFLTKSETQAKYGW